MKRYLCQFKHWYGWRTDCGFDTAAPARRYCKHITDALSDHPSSRVYDALAKRVIFEYEHQED